MQFLMYACLTLLVLTLAAIAQQPRPAIDTKAAAPPPASVNGQQPNPSVHADLERELTKLAAKVNVLLEPKKEDTKLAETFMDFLSKLVTLAATILGCFVSYKGLKKIPVVKDNSEIVILSLSAVVLLVLFYLLSGLVTSVLYVLIAIIILSIALVLAAAHLLKFIDDKYPEVKDSIIAHFEGTKTDASVRRMARDNVRRMEDWLSSLVFIQQIKGEKQLELAGSFVEGFDRSLFQIHPDKGIAAHWKNLDDRMLVPVMASVTIYLKDELRGEVVNIQPGMVVITVSGEVQYKRFSNEGFTLMGESLLNMQHEQLKKLLEQQTALNNDLKLYGSQSI